jgi:predicted acetyltransferase
MITLEKVGIEKKEVLRQLLELYIYEFSKYLDMIQIREDGTYGYDALDSFFENESFTCYFIKQDHQLAGFAVVEALPEYYYMKEFFILKKGKGIGKDAAKQIFNLHRGNWKITQFMNNYPAQAFWRKVISDYTQGFEEYYDEKRRSVQTFNNQELKIN